MTDVWEASTARVRLRVPSQADLTELFALYSDPRVWAADPVSRHVEERQTELAIQRWRRGWEDDEQGMWVARTRGEGHLVGVGGCFVRYGTPGTWGSG